MPDSFATPWTIARQAPLSMGFPRQECWSGFPFPPPGDLPDPGIKSMCPALQTDFYRRVAGGVSAPGWSAPRQENHPQGASGPGPWFLLTLLGSRTCSALASSCLWHLPRWEGLLCARPCAGCWSCCEWMRRDLNDNFPVICAFGVLAVYGQGYPSVLLEHLLNLAEQGEKNFGLPELICIIWVSAAILTSSQHSRSPGTYFILPLFVITVGKIKQELYFPHPPSNDNTPPENCGALQPNGSWERPLESSAAPRPRCLLLGASEDLAKRSGRCYSLAVLSLKSSYFLLP